MKPVDFEEEKKWAQAHEEEYRKNKDGMDVVERNRFEGFMAYLQSQYVQSKKLPPVERMAIPSPSIKRLYAEGAVPFDAFDDGRLDICGCGHVIGAHKDGLFACLAKKCPCTAYRRDARFVLPPWGSERPGSPVKA